MYGRIASHQIAAALSDTPVVLIQGPRQSGKSTLAQTAADEHFGANYITLDDPLALAEARENPASFLKSRRPPVVIDEVQRAPGLFLALKLFVDRDRKPGQFLLTGSANVLLLPKVADSLAGRMEVVELMPLCQAEFDASGTNAVDQLFETDPFPRILRSGCSLVERLGRGGYPEPAMRKDPSRREAWYQSYVRTILERDVRDLANVSGLTQLPRLLTLLAARSGQTLNLSSLSVETGIPHTTLTRYVDLFKALFLLTMIPAWSAETDTRLTKSPKAFLVDTALLCYLAGIRPDSLPSDPIRYAPILKTLVANELHRLSRLSQTKPFLAHLRTVKNKEVDFVLEARDGRIIGIEVRTEQAPMPGHFDGLKFLRELAGERFHHGYVLYDGTETMPFGECMTALPFNALWALD